MPEKFPTTGNGKGDKSRVSKTKEYWNNFDAIDFKSDKKKKEKKKK